MFVIPRGEIFLYSPLRKINFRSNERQITERNELDIYHENQ